MDWDGTGRAQIVTVQDAAGAILDVRTMSNFSSGQYLVWNLSGHVQIVFTRTAGPNAVMSGLFFDVPNGNGTATSSSGPSAAFLGADTTTLGNWKGVYGANGYGIVSDATSYPSYVTVTPSGNGTYNWGSTSDSRGLQRSAASDRVASVWYGGTSFTVDLSFNDSAVHKVAVYCVDWDTTGRTQTVTVQDAAGATLDVRTISSFSSGQYLVWNLSGHVRLVFTTVSGSNAVMSGLFFDGTTTTSPALLPAAFLKVDTTTLGNWKGVYGANGYGIVSDATSYPSYVTVTPSGNATYDWGSTSDSRGLQRSAASDRVASVWYSGTSFTVDLAFNDSAVHKVAVYCVDWDMTTRAQTVTVQDGAGSAIDTRLMSSFSGGQYLVWNLSGHVRLVFTRIGGSNAVMNGIFFDPVGF